MTGNNLEDELAAICAEMADTSNALEKVQRNLETYVRAKAPIAAIDMTRTSIEVLEKRLQNLRERLDQLEGVGPCAPWPIAPFEYSSDLGV
jgi:predicted RNase H-like nuclease (RuvC/YqgF family)